MVFLVLRVKTVVFDSLPEKQSPCRPRRGQNSLKKLRRAGNKQKSRANRGEEKTTDTLKASCATDGGLVYFA